LGQGLIRAGYRVGIAGDTVMVQGTYGTATLTGIEALRFADTGIITLADLRAAPGTEDLVTLLADGTPGFVMPTAYTGPLALTYQFTGTDGSDVLSGTGRNDFVYLGTGDDAANMGADEKFRQCAPPCSRTDTSPECTLRFLPSTSAVCRPQTGEIGWCATSGRRWRKKGSGERHLFAHGIAPRWRHQRCAGITS
jgi:hypothetical protein